MKIANLKRKLESTGAQVKFEAEETRWGGWHITMTCRVGGYYDVEATEQVHKTLDVRTVDDAIAVMLLGGVDYFASKPWHDESDSMTDYCAWWFNRKLKDVDYLVESCKGCRLAPAA